MNKQQIKEAIDKISTSDVFSSISRYHNEIIILKDLARSYLKALESGISDTKHCNCCVLENCYSNEVCPFISHIVARDNEIIEKNAHIQGQNDAIAELEWELKDRDEKIKKFEKEIERYRNRDGNASVQLSYTDDNRPYNFIDLKVCDFGVSDNGYVVESEFVNSLVLKVKQLEAEVKLLKEELKQREAQVHWKCIEIEKLEAEVKRLKGEG